MIPFRTMPPGGVPSVVMWVTTEPLAMKSVSFHKWCGVARCEQVTTQRHNRKGLGETRVPNLLTILLSFFLRCRFYSFVFPTLSTWASTSLFLYGPSLCLRYPLRRLPIFPFQDRCLPKLWYSHHRLRAVLVSSGSTTGCLSVDPSSSIVLYPTDRTRDRASPFPYHENRIDGDTPTANTDPAATGKAYATATVPFIREDQRACPERGY